jgi:hypothetical protein
MSDASFHADPVIQRRSWRNRIALFLLFGLAAVGLFIYVTASFGIVVGEEFAPDAFRRRSFIYYEIPMIGIQVWPIEHSDSTGELEKHLVDAKILDVQPAEKGEDEHWDLVQATRGADPSMPPVAHGDARILCYYLDAVDNEGNSVWTAWSKENKPLAQVVWPAVAKVAQQQLYLLTPGLLSLAEAESDPQRLQQRINEFLSEKYLLFANCQQQLERHEEAIDLFTEALRHQPDSVEALNGRASSFRALGKSTEADADRAEVRKIAGD